MNNLEKILNKKFENNNNLIIVFDIYSVNGYVNKLLIANNLNKIINKEKYPVFFINILKYEKDIEDLLQKKIEKFPLVLKFKNKELIEAYDNFINF